MDECSPEVDVCDPTIFFPPYHTDLPVTGFMGLDLLWWAAMMTTFGVVLLGTALKWRHDRV